MTDNGVSEPVTEDTPDCGVVTILQRPDWIEHQRAIMDSELPGNRREAAWFLLWEDDLCPLDGTKLPAWKRKVTLPRARKIGAKRSPLISRGYTT